MCGMGTSTRSSKDFGIGQGLVDPVLTCGSEPKMDAVQTAVVGSVCAGLVLDAGRHEVRSSDVCSVGDTRCHSLKDVVVIIMHTHHLCRTLREALGCLHRVTVLPPPCDPTRPDKRWATAGARLHTKTALCAGLACGRGFEESTMTSMTIVVREALCMYAGGAWVPQGRSLVQCVRGAK